MQPLIGEPALSILVTFIGLEGRGADMSGGQLGGVGWRWPAFVAAVAGAGFMGSAAGSIASLPGLRSSLRTAQGIETHIQDLDRSPADVVRLEAMALDGVRYAEQVVATFERYAVVGVVLMLFAIAAMCAFRWPAVRTFVPAGPAVVFAGGLYALFGAVPVPPDAESADLAGFSQALFGLGLILLVFATGVDASRTARERQESLMAALVRREGDAERRVVDIAHDLEDSAIRLTDRRTS